jgi:hypothetical protein
LTDHTSTAIALAADEAAANSSSSNPVGPSAASCRVNDRLLAEDLAPSALRVKGLLAQVRAKLACTGRKERAALGKRGGEGVCTAVGKNMSAAW